ncbi:MAG: hypothetical protein E6538_08495 [Paeniclostridium sordellii]|nr:hypothetical protein [Paeniclostridium sordellii]
MKIESKLANEEIKKYFEFDVKINIVESDNIKRESGKFKDFISYIKE